MPVPLQRFQEILQAHKTIIGRIDAHAKPKLQFEIVIDVLVGRAGEDMVAIASFLKILCQSPRL